MSALDTRRREDFARVRALCARSGGRIELLSANGDAPTVLQLRLHYRTAAGESYPESFLSSVDLTIQIPAGFPFRSPPVALLDPPVLHPNVYRSGMVCLGTQWVVSEFLDLLVTRVVRIITYQEDVLNEDAPAYGPAVQWYRRRRKLFPRDFPTDTADTVAAPKRSQGMLWNDIR